MEVQERNSTRIYSLSSGKKAPEWLGERARRNLQKSDASYRRRIDLLQDFEMPVASNRIRQSPDGRFVFVTGTYKPRMRCYEVEELGMKFERYLDSDALDLLVLGEDYGKVAILGADRSVSFHAPYGYHDSVRLPTFGRALAYEPSTCELLVAGCGGRRGGAKNGGNSDGEIYRFNLDEGRFSQPLSFSSASKKPRRGKGDNEGTFAGDGDGGGARIIRGAGANCLAVSPSHALSAAGAEDGTVRFWDNRDRGGGGLGDVDLRPFLNLDVASAAQGYGFYDGAGEGSSSDVHSGRFPGEVTSLAFDASGMHMVAGTGGGCVALYDLRSSKPLLVKEHQYGLPIHTVQFHSGSGTVLSGDPKLVKIWSAGTSSSASSSLGSVIANVEAIGGDFNHFITSGDATDPSGQTSGLLLCAGEQPRVQAYYCPVLGPAPRWSSFLDGITEELEEKDRGESSEGAEGEGADGDSRVETVYEDYKFLTRSEIDRLGISNLVGTPLLRGYMHGFFIHSGLYNRVRAVAKPFEYGEYRKQKIRERIEEKSKSRIAPRVSSSSKEKKKKVKANATVNVGMAGRLEKKATGNTKAGKMAKALVEDDRFGGLFKNKDFRIDEASEDFLLRNPNGAAQLKRGGKDDMDSDDEGDNGEDDDDDSRDGSNGEDEQWSGESGEDDDGMDGGENDSYSSDSDEDGFRGGKVRGEAFTTLETTSTKESSTTNKKQEPNKKKKKKTKNVMYEGDDYTDAAAQSEASKRKKEELSLSVAERLEMQKSDSQFVGEAKRLKVAGQGVVREVTYIPKASRKKMEEEEKTLKEASKKDDRTGRSRRGVRDLGFKTPFKHHGK